MFFTLTRNATGRGTLQAQEERRLNLQAGNSENPAGLARGGFLSFTGRLKVTFKHGMR